MGLGVVAIGVVSVPLWLVRERTAAIVNAEVDPLAVTPIHRVLDSSGKLSRRSWDLSSILPGEVDNPKMLVEALNFRNIPPKLNLETNVTVGEGADIRACDPEGVACDKIVGTNISNYPFGTRDLTPSKPSLEVGSVQLKIWGSGTYTEVLKLTDPETGGLAASASAVITISNITKRSYLPQVGVNTKGPVLRRIMPAPCSKFPFTVTHKTYLIGVYK